MTNSKKNSDVKSKTYSLHDMYSIFTSSQNKLKTKNKQKKQVSVCVCSSRRQQVTNVC